MKEMGQILVEFMDRWYLEGRFSGSVLVAKGDRVLVSKGYGYANHEYKILNTEKTIYKIASITKHFTAVAVLQLCESGKLSLEDSVDRYLPQYNYANQLTIHNLLSHTSGVPNYTDFPEYSTRNRVDVDTIISWLNDKPLNFRPGDGVDKSNSDYVLLSKVVEVVSGVDFEHYVLENILKPLGLISTGVSNNSDVIPNMAYGYSVSGEGVVNADYYDMSGAYGSGFMYSNTEDLLKWIVA